MLSLMTFSQQLCVASTSRNFLLQVQRPESSVKSRRTVTEVNSEGALNTYDVVYIISRCEMQRLRDSGRLGDNKWFLFPRNVKLV